MKRRSLLLTLLLSVLLVTSTDAATWYVAPSGGAGCSQIRTSPQGGLGNALGCLSPGDTLFLRPGSYSCGTCLDNPPGGNSSQRITIAGDPQDSPLAAIVHLGNGGNGMTLRQSSSSFITFNNILFNADGSGGGNSGIKVTCGGSATDASHHIRVSNSEVINGSGQGILDNTGQCSPQNPGFNEYVNNHVHGNGHDTQLDHGIYINSSDSLVDGNDIHDNAGCGIHQFSSAGCNGGPSNRVIIRNNKTYNHNGQCGVGLLFGSGNDNFVYNNVSYRNRANAFMFSTCGNSNHLLNNTGANNGGDCIRNQTDNADIRNNICLHNGSDGIFNEGSFSQSNNTFTGSPNFKNEAADDYRITAGSAAIGAGTNLSSIFTTDACGSARPASGAWDTGAYVVASANLTTCSPGSPPPPPPPPPPTGTQAIWLTFEEGFGTTATDLNQNGNTATLATTLTALPTWSFSSARLGNFGLHFNNAGDHLVLNLQNTTVPANWTLAFSINSDDAQSGANDTFPVWAQMTPDGSGELSFNWDNLIAGRRQAFVVGIGGNVYNRCIIQTAMSAGTWYRLMETYDGTNIRCYLNGVLQQTTPTANLPGNFSVFYLSRYTASVWWRGSIDEFIFDTKTYSQAEATSDYNRTFLPPPVGPTQGRH